MFVEIAVDSSHLEQTVRLNFPSDRQHFRETLLSSEETDKQIPVGQRIGTHHLRIEGPDTSVSANGDQPQRTNEILSHESTRLALVSTIQFVAALSRLKDDLTIELDDSITLAYTPVEDKSTVIDQVSRLRLWNGKNNATIPQARPLSQGEILGCTAPRLSDVDALLFVFPSYSETH